MAEKLIFITWNNAGSLLLLFMIVFHFKTDFSSVLGASFLASPKSNREKSAHRKIG